MALIVEYHVVADMYPVGEAITAGMPVTFNSDGEVIKVAGNDSAQIIGIAGDSYLASEGHTTAYSESLNIGGTTRYTSNRVSDFYNETAASGKITVYHGGGKFWISEDLVVSIEGVGPGDLLEGSTAGKYRKDSTAGQVIAIAAGTPAVYPSGVPGVETTDGSLAIKNAGTDNLWMPIILRI